MLDVYGLQNVSMSYSFTTTGADSVGTGARAPTFTNDWVRGHRE